MGRSPLKALLDAIRAQSWAPHTGHSRVGKAAQGKERVGQGLVFGARRTTGKAGNHPHGVDRQQEMEPFIAAQVVAPAAIGQPGQPPGPAARRIAGRHPRAIAGFREATLGRQEGHEMPHHGHQCLVVLPHVALELLPAGPRRQGRPQGARRIAGKAALTAKALPWSKARQRHSLTPTEGGLRPRVWRRGQGGLAKVINHNV
jgi:hypothetical protein